MPVAIYRADGACVLADPSAPAPLRTEALPAHREAIQRALRGETVREIVTFGGYSADAFFVPLAGPAGAIEHVALVVGGAAHEDVVSRLAREADEANRMRDDFLSTASHELRTPLQAILGFARLLRAREHDEAAREKALEVIERNARQQAQLIDDLLDVSRIITGRLQLSLVAVDLAELLRQALAIARPAAEAKGISLRADVDTVDGTMLGDPDRLRQAFWNLLSNAVKFTPRGGQVQVTLEEKDGGLCVSVRDSGKGIPAASLPFLFERFRRLDGGAPTASPGGLGLGLAIVRHLVEMHGGWVRAESGGLGAGATFVVALPVRNSITPTAVVSSLRPPPPPSVPPASSSDDLLRGKTVLAVDDEPDARDLLDAIFTHKGARVRCTASAAEAIAAFRAEPPDVVVSDVGLPGADGYELVRKLRALDAELQRPPTPMVALTAYARDQDRQRARAAGYDRHVPKPVDPEELVTVVARLVHAA